MRFYLLNYVNMSRVYARKGLFGLDRVEVMAGFRISWTTSKFISHSCLTFISTYHVDVVCS